MKFNSQICTTKEQSERLLTLGLKKETADCQYAAFVRDWDGNLIAKPKWRFYDHNKGFVVENLERMECCPAWSLHRLIELAEVSVEVSGLWVRISSTYRYEEKDNAYDNLIDAIADLINNDVFNKEYLDLPGL